VDITLYEFPPTRSARCRWTLQELDLPFTSAGGRESFGSPEYKKIHPLGKLPAIEIDGRIMFESAAISTWLADAVPEKGLIAKPGSWDRAMHEQWSYYTFAELEAHVWSSARNTFVYDEDKRIADIIPQNDAEFRRAIAVVDDALSRSDYLVANAFSVTDIILAYAANWGRRFKLTDEAPHVEAWLDRLYERPHCTLSKPE
jgi:glutathione S-transferase